MTLIIANHVQCNQCPMLSIKCTSGRMFLMFEVKWSNLLQANAAKVHL